MDSNMPHNENTSESPLSSVEFRFIRSPFFRVVHLDGVFGGVSPRGDIHMAVFNERHPIPNSVKHELTPQGTLGIEISRDIGPGIIMRELETDVIMSLEAAKAVRGWLDQKISEVENRPRESGVDNPDKSGEDTHQ